MKYYKILRGLKSCHGGSYNWTIGKKTPYEVIYPCCSGWHLASEKDLRHWLGEGLTVYEAKVASDSHIVRDAQKYVANSVILTKKVNTLTISKLRQINRALLSLYLEHISTKYRYKSQQPFILKCLKIMFNKKGTDIKRTALRQIPIHGQYQSDIVWCLLSYLYSCTVVDSLYSPELPVKYDKLIGSIIIHVLNGKKEK